MNQVGFAQALDTVMGTCDPLAMTLDGDGTFILFIGKASEGEHSRLACEQA